MEELIKKVVCYEINNIIFREKDDATQYAIKKNLMFGKRSICPECKNALSLVLFDRLVELRCTQCNYCRGSYKLIPNQIEFIANILNDLTK